jgi:hypothetical protein
MINVAVHEIRLLVLTKTFINILYDGSNTKLNSTSKCHYSLFGPECTVYKRTGLYT